MEEWDLDGLTHENIEEDINLIPSRIREEWNNDDGIYSCMQGDFPYIDNKYKVLKKEIDKVLIKKMGKMIGPCIRFADTHTVHKNSMQGGVILRFVFQYHDKSISIGNCDAFALECDIAMESISKGLKKYPWKPLIIRDEDGQPLYGYIFMS
tara:strand:+ start:283 stop:738 length:456 start_codon:yes stop_codon:yes gene_type:complete